MVKQKDPGLFDDKSSVSRAIGVESSLIHKKIRKDAPDGVTELLTSKDLFGEIVDGLTSKVKQEGSGSPPALRDLGSADTDPYRPRAPGDSQSYAAVDRAYSTLLQDSHLHRDVEKLSRLEPPSGKEASSDYGRYYLLERVASGGMAEVFRAKRKGVEGFEKIVAIKRILPHLSTNKDFVEMFIAEAKIVASLNHPNIVQIFDLGKIDDSYYIAMEFVEGHDLRTILTRARERRSPIGVDLAALIAARVGAALEYAHRHRNSDGYELRIVHRDVSPQNILVSNEGEVKLTDFGIAKAATKASHTDAGSLRGKLLYMSPEQAWGRAIDKRSDIFALGAVFYEILTGHLLFTGNSEFSILERVREARFVPPSSLNPAVPIELEAVATRALRKDPNERYQDAAEMLLDLDSYLRRRPAVGSGDLARVAARLLAPAPTSL